jgi:Cu/Ag efflux protein CusF
MKTKIIAITATVAIAVGVAACSQPAPPADTSATSEATAPAAATGPIRSTGVVVAVNPTAGTVTLNHEPIPAIHWSAMTMEFKADPAILQGVAAGDRVAFELKSATEPQTVTVVQKQ